MGSAQSTHIESTPRDVIIACPCETEKAEGQEINDIYESEDEESLVEESNEEDDSFEERLLILGEIRQLRQLAEFFLCPEKPVEVNPSTTARCYFDRPSANLPVECADSEERNLILKDMKAMKQLAIDYLHPELPVTVTDPCVFGRNYFYRPSAEYSEDSEERNLILKDMEAMKQLAIDYLHPELPVTVTDPCACGRNYFSRPSAQPYDISRDEHDAEEEERHVILEEVRWMKTLANGFMHPEVHVDYSGFEAEVHFEMDEDIDISSTDHYHGSSDADNVDPYVSGKPMEGNLAFSPGCVMMMH